MAPRIWTDQLMIYDRSDSDLETLAGQFVDEGQGRYAAAPTKRPSDIAEVMNKFVNLKQLIFYLHGRPGYMGYVGGTGGVNFDNAKDYLSPSHSQLFNGPGRAVFAGCNIAEGQVGRDFLLAAGTYLFRGKGGIVGGTTSINFSARFGLMDIFMPPWGKMRLLKLDAEGNLLDEKLF